jgi:hypothetical protein
MSSSPDTPERRDEKAHVLADEQLVKAKDLRRFKWETRGLYLLAVGLVVLVAMFGERVGDVVSQIQSERERNTLTACIRANEQNAAIVGFVRSTVPPGRRGEAIVKAYLDRAARTFPQRNCAQEVRERVKGSSP